jgi:nitrite reductase (NADH) large subunit
MADLNTNWVCSICGYVHRGSEPPAECPVCGVSRENFEPCRNNASPSPAAEPAAAAASPSVPDALRVVVIGAGGAGTAAVESLRKAAPGAEIVLISQETELPYYRLNLTRYLAGEVHRPDLFIHPPAWYEEQQIQLLLGT